MAFKHSMKRGDTLPVLRYPLLPGVDIPPGSTVRFLMSPRPGHPPTVNGDARIVDGFLEYAWAAGDTHKGGLHYGEFEAVVPGGGKRTVPDNGYIYIQITQDIGDGGAVAPPALIVLSAALVEAGADVASGSASVGISLSGAMAEDGSDTASGSLTITTPAPGSISLSAALVEAGADTASGAASVGIAMSAAMVEPGADTASGSLAVADAVITYSDDATAVTALWTGYAADDFTASVVLPSDDTIQLAVSSSPDLSNPVFGPPVATAGGYAKPTISGLQRGTEYHYAIRKGSTIYRAITGKFRTLPAAGPASFRFGFGNCNSGTSSVAFEAMDRFDPLFVMHLGDLHYSDIAVNDPQLYHAALNGRFTGRLAPLMRNRSFLYTWSDHDYGPDGSDKASPGRPAALSVYKSRVPHPPFAYANPDDPIAYAFTVGRIRFVVPDGRSQTVDFQTTWGADQKAWVLDQITQAKSSGQFVCLCNDLPWYSEFSATDRVDLGNHIAAQGMEGRVFSICGDAHSIQIDDGSNKQFATVGSARVPTFHAGPFSQGNSIKGGPWSHGSFVESSRQGGYIDVVDNGGDEIDLTFNAYKDDGIPVVSFAFKLSRLGFVGGPTYAIAASGTTVDEGASVTFTVTSNRPNTTVTVNLSGVSASDIVGGNLAPQVALDGAGAGAVTVALTADALTEGVETLTATVGGTSITASVQVQDTSTAPPPPAASAPLIVRQAVGHSAGTSSAANPTVATLSAPATAGNLLVLFLMSDKAATDFVVPAGFVRQAGHVTGAGVSGAIYTKTAEGGETAVASYLSAAGSYLETLLIETTATAMDQVALGTAQVSTTSRGTSATVSASANTLALVTWHNDSASTTTSATAAGFNAGWTAIAGSGVGTAYPLLSSSSGAPGWVAASQAVSGTGPITATFAYTGGSSDENMVMLITLVRK